MGAFAPMVGRRAGRFPAFRHGDSSHHNDAVSYSSGMGIQDRDYYREWWRKRTGYVERAQFRLPSFSRRARTPWPPFVSWLVGIVGIVSFFAFLLKAYLSV